MNAIALLEDLMRRGFEVESDGSDIHCRGTIEPLTLELLETLKRNKREIVGVLTSHDRELFLELLRAGLSSKWQDYLLERVEILVDHEGYTQEDAQGEVIKMIPHYQNLN